MKKENKYKDLYAGFIIAIVTAVITPLVIKLWQVTLYQPINSEMVEQVQEKHNRDKEALDYSDILEINRETILVPVKSLELVERHEKYYFLRNNDGDLYISNNEDLRQDRKSTRLNSSHVSISYAVFCLKKKKKVIYYNY